MKRLGYVFKKDAWMEVQAPGFRYYHKLAKMSLRDPQYEALQYFDAISSKIEYRTCSKADAEKIASENCQNPHTISVDKEFDFPSFCFDMTTGIGKSRLMGACIYYLYKTKGYKHFFILAPGNTIYDKMRREAVPGHPKYMFKGLEAEMGRPKVYDGENYLSYPVRYIQEEMVVEKTSDIQIFIFNISKIFTRGDIEFKFHKFNENLGGSFADVLRSFDDLVICMDEAHRYYAPASKKAINYLNPVLGLEYTATPKSTNKNIIYHYGLEDGAGKFLKIPVVMGRTNTAGYSDDDIEEMKLKDGIKLHERRKSIVYKYCIDNQLEQVKPIVLIACKDTTHARKIKEKIDSDAFFGGRYVGKVIEIDSSTSGAETEENIQKLLTIEKNTNPIEIVLHVYKLKEGWDVNNLFTIIPLNAAKSDILALQTIGRGLRLPFGEITGIEELDTLDIVAHDHYREIVDDIKNNPVFKKRNLDEEDIPNTKTVMVEPAVENQQISLFDEALCESKVKSYQDLNDENVVENLFAEYQKAFVKKVAPKKSESDSGQMSIFDYFANDDEKETNDGTASDHKMTQTDMGTDAVDTSFTVHQGDASLQIDLQKSSGSNMIAVGMDVDRLGLMSVVGQPNPINDIMGAQRATIETLVEAMGEEAGLSFAYQKYFGDKYSYEDFKAAYDRLSQNIKEFTELKEMEYAAITHHEDVEYQHDVKYFKAEEVALSESLKEYISRIIKIHRLREVRVLTGFTRLEAPEPEVDEQSHIVKLKCSSGEKWLPAVEINGEGVFIELNKEKINQWMQIETVKSRSDKYEECYAAYCQKKGWENFKPRNAEYVLLHTLSHMLIKEMSMQSGYSSSALHERIYSSENMCGILIYTGAADKEGSLGGLVELGGMNKFLPLLKGALENGLTCTTDPECFMKNPTSERLNGAACHSCTMISETACENGNRLLDRALVVPVPEHEEMGYFRELVRDLCGIQV